MARGRQIIDIPLGVGRNAGSDPRLVQPGKALEAENVYQDRAGELQKRRGYTQLSTDTKAGGSLGTRPSALHSINGNPFMLENSDLYSHDSTADNWINQGSALPSKFDPVLPIQANLGFSSASAGSFVFDVGIPLFAFSAWYGTGTPTAGLGAIETLLIRVNGTIVEKETTTNLGTHMFALSASGTSGYIGGINPVTYLLNNNLSYRYYDVNAETFTNAGNIITDWAGGQLAVVANTTSTFVVAYADTANDLRIREFDDAGNLLNTFTDVAFNPQRIALVKTAARTYCFFYDNAQGTYVVVLDQNMGVISGPTQIDATVAQDTLTIGACSVTSTSVRYYYTVDGATTITPPWGGGTVTSPFRTVRTGTVTDAGAVTGPTTIANGVGISSNPWYNTALAKSYILCQYIDTNTVADSRQNATFLIDESGNILGRFLVGESFGDHEQAWSVLPTPTSVLGATFLAVFAYENSRPSAYQGVTPSPTIYFTVHTASATTANPMEVTKGILGGSALLGAGALTTFDGRQVTQAGFNVHPPYVDATAVAAGGSLADGDYGIIATYEWYDAKGNFYRSASSVADTVTIAGGGGSGSITLNTPNLRFTNKTAVKLILYRTLVNGTLYYRAAEATNNTAADVTASTLSAADSTISSNELLYTSGGELDNIESPGVKHFVQTEDKLLIIPAFHRRSIWESKPIARGFGPEFSDFLILNLTGLEGDLEALASMNGRIIAFTRGSIWYFSGTGSDALGNGSYTQPRLLSRDYGCINNTSVQSTAAGVLFQSENGFCLLTQSLQVVYIGEGVRDIVSENTAAKVHDSILHRDLSQVWFAVDTGGTSLVLIYDYSRDAWSKYDMAARYMSSDIFLGDSVVAYCESDNTPFKEDTSFTDGSASYTMKTKTPWIRLGATEGSQRIQEIAILGEFRSAHSLVVKTYFDYDATTAVETFTIVSTDIQTVANDPYIARITPTQQQCAAVMFEIYDSAHAGTEESLTLTSLSIEVLPEDGLLRVADAQRS